MKFYPRVGFWGGVPIHKKHEIRAYSLYFQGLPRALFYCMHGSSLLIELAGDDNNSATVPVVGVRMPPEEFV